MPVASHLRRRSRGSILVVALGLLGVLTIMAFSFAALMRIELEAARNASEAAQLDNLKTMGLYHAIREIVQNPHQGALVTPVVTPVDPTADPEKAKGKAWHFPPDKLDDPLAKPEEKLSFGQVIPRDLQDRGMLLMEIQVQGGSQVPLNPRSGQEAANAQLRLARVLEALPMSSGETAAAVVSDNKTLAFQLLDGGVEKIPTKEHVGVVTGSTPERYQKLATYLTAFARLVPSFAKNDHQPPDFDGDDLTMDDAPRICLNTAPERVLVGLFHDTQYEFPTELADGASSVEIAHVGAIWPISTGTTASNVAQRIIALREGSPPAVPPVVIATWHAFRTLVLEDLVGRSQISAKEAAAIWANVNPNWSFTWNRNAACPNAFEFQAPAGTYVPAVGKDRAGLYNHVSLGRRSRSGLSASLGPDGYYEINTHLRIGLPVDIKTPVQTTHNSGLSSVYGRMFPDTRKKDQYTNFYLLTISGPAGGQLREITGNTVPPVGKNWFNSYVTPNFSVKPKYGWGYTIFRPAVAEKQFSAAVKLYNIWELTTQAEFEEPGAVAFNQITAYPEPGNRSASIEGIYEGSLALATREADRAGQALCLHFDNDFSNDPDPAIGIDADLKVYQADGTEVAVGNLITNTSIAQGNPRFPDGAYLENYALCYTGAGLIGEDSHAWGMWIKPNAGFFNYQGDADTKVIVRCEAGDKSVSVYNVNGDLKAKVSGFAAESYTTDWKPGEWHYLGFRWYENSGGTGQMEIYVDRLLKKTIALAGTFNLEADDQAVRLGRVPATIDEFRSQTSAGAGVAPDVCTNNSQKDRYYTTGTWQSAWSTVHGFSIDEDETLGTCRWTEYMPTTYAGVDGIPGTPDDDGSNVQVYVEFDRNGNGSADVTSCVMGGGPKPAATPAVPSGIEPVDDACRTAYYGSGSTVQDEAHGEPVWPGSPDDPLLGRQGEGQPVVVVNSISGWKSNQCNARGPGDVPLRCGGPLFGHAAGHGNLSAANLSQLGRLTATSDGARMRVVVILRAAPAPPGSPAFVRYGDRIVETPIVDDIEITVIHKFPKIIRWYERGGLEWYSRAP